jgi:capsular polysaccharide transport system ATP-binding protein
MIEAVNVTKEYRTEGRVHPAVNGVSFSVARGEKLALIGRNGAGKSTLIRLLGGVELPTSGRIEQAMWVSWPLALQGGFQGSLTRNDDMRFIARIYNKPYDDIKAYVEDFAELGNICRNRSKSIPSECAPGSSLRYRSPSTSIAT